MSLFGAGVYEAVLIVWIYSGMECARHLILTNHTHSPRLFLLSLVANDPYRHMLIGGHNDLAHRRLLNCILSDIVVHANGAYILLLAHIHVVSWAFRSYPLMAS